jgi:hypothetical protein
LNQKRSRPLQKAAKALIIAQECGDETFHGRPCRYCKGTTRWTRNTSCVTCFPKREKKLTLRQAAVQRGDRFFEGKPCKWCQGTSRYAVNGTCVRCANDRNVQAYRSDPEVRARVMAQAKAWQKDNRLRYILKQAESRARHRGLPFALTLEDVPVPTHCPVLGIPLDSRDRDHTPSLDRIKNEKGYTPDNVAVISMRANRIKSDAELHELEAIVEFVKRHQSLATQSENPVQLRLVA